MKKYLFIAILVIILMLFFNINLFSKNLLSNEVHINTNMFSFPLANKVLLDKSYVVEFPYCGIMIENIYSKYYKILNWENPYLNNAKNTHNINDLNTFSKSGKINFYNTYFSVFLNIFPGFGMGSFIFGNNTFGILQVIIQMSSSIFYIIGISQMDKTSYETWIFPHTMINVGHYIFFGGIIFGIVSSIVYAVQNPVEENEF